MSTYTSEAFETIRAMIAGFFSILPQIIIAIFLFVALWALAGIISRIVTRAVTVKVRAGVGKAIGRIVYIILLFAAFLLSITIVAPSIKAAELLQLLGVGSVAIGFAFRDILQNFLAGLLILFRQPFKEGDWIVFEGYEGTVTEISTRSTWLRTFDGRDITIPNGELFTNPVSIVTKDPDARSQYDVGISYDADIEIAKAAISEVLEGVKEIYAKPSPDVGVHELADSAVVLRVRWWSKTSDIYRTRQNVLQQIKETLDERGIGIPYPHQQVFFDGKIESSTPQA